MLQFEPATVEDIPYMLQVEARSNPHPWPESHLQTSFTSKYDNYIFVIDGCAAGYLISQNVGPERHLIHICVDKAFQGKGHGKEALELLKLIAKNTKQYEIWLEVRASNHVAQDLYNNLGFNEVSVRKDYYPCDTAREDGIVMVAYLDE